MTLHLNRLLDNYFLFKRCPIDKITVVANSRRKNQCYILQSICGGILSILNETEYDKSYMCDPQRLICKTDRSLRYPREDVLDPWLPTERQAMTLIRLRAPVILLILSISGSNDL